MRRSSSSSEAEGASRLRMLLPVLTAVVVVVISAIVAVVVSAIVVVVVSAIVVVVVMLTVRGPPTIPSSSSSS